ncbi:MAG TPA: lysylphosphatidylglycerol synthase domain-containing protein, partial [Stellaceae bacterium]|nr:lysylphosphatidylglycerol synthase domain-containing protein [Stellaceae bacterium]
GTALSSVLIDRAVGLLSLCLVLTALLPALVPWLPHRALLGSLLLVLGAVYGGLGVAMVLDRVPERLRRRRPVQLVAALATDLRRTLLRPGAALRALAPNLAGLALQTALVAVVGRALGSGAPALGYILVVPLATLAMQIPLSIGGWGLREGGFVMGFALFGVAAPQAVAMSVLLGLSNALVTLPGGVIWLMLRERRALPVDSAA